MATRPLPRERRDEGEDGRVGEEGSAEPEEEGEHGMGGEEEERAEEDEGEEEESAEEEEEEEMEERVVKRKIVIVVSFGGKGEEGEEQEEEEEGRRSPSPRQDVEVGCQVDGCNADLGEAKRYHRRHKVCEGHAKAAVARVGRVEQRFCQQCSRFHEISQFDGAKRSCRNRLAGHNERRRKVPSDMKADVSKQQVAVP